MTDRFRRLLRTGRKPSVDPTDGSSTSTTRILDKIWQDNRRNTITASSTRRRGGNVSDIEHFTGPPAGLSGATLVFLSEAKARASIAGVSSPLLILFGGAVPSRESGAEVFLSSATGVSVFALVGKRWFNLADESAVDDDSGDRVGDDDNDDGGDDDDNGAKEEKKDVRGGGGAAAAPEYRVRQPAVQRWKDMLEREKETMQRVGHTCVVYKRGGEDDVELVVFGGRARFFMNDLWVFSLATARWTQVNENCTDRAELAQTYRPSPRWGHSAVVTAPADDVAGAADMWVFGGLDSRLGMASSELFRFDLAVQSWVDVKAVDGDLNKPAARFQHSAVARDGSIFVFGGRDEDGTVFNDLWRFCTSSLSWEKIQAADVNQLWPLPVFAHVAMVALDPCSPAMLVFDTADGGVMWEYSFPASMWVRRAWDAQQATSAVGCADSREATASVFVLSTSVEEGSVLWECYPESAIGGGSLNDIPTELAMLLFRSLSELCDSDVDKARNLSSAAGVCKRWREVLLSDEADSEFWKDLCLVLARRPYQRRCFPIPRDPGGSIFEALMELPDETPNLSRMGLFLSAVAREKRGYDFSRVRSAKLLDYQEIAALCPSREQLAQTLVRGMAQCKLTVVGARGVGKTYFLLVYTTNAFPSVYIPKVLDNYVANVMVHGMPVNLSLWDTDTDDDELRPLSYSGTDVFMMCYSIIDEDSLRQLDEVYFPEVRAVCPEAACIVVGLKCDLMNDATTLALLHSRGEDIVSKEEGERVARKHGAWFHAQSSSLTTREMKTSFDVATSMGLFKQIGGNSKRGRKGGRGKGCPVQ